MRYLTVFLLCLIPLGYGAKELSKSEIFQLFGEMVWHGPRDQAKVALTFDDGPSVPHTFEVLQILAAENVKGTFFLVGQEMRRFPQATKAIVDAGHEIGNHTDKHNRMVLRTPWAVRRDLSKTDAAIREAGYEGEILFRAPYGAKLVSLPWVLQQQERLSVMWSLEGDSNRDLWDQPEEMAQQIVEQAQNGDIILLHPMFKSRAGTRAALPKILRGLKARGFEMVTVSELLGRTGR